MKAVQLLVNSHLPPDLRDYTRPLDAKNIGRLMADVARNHPDKYEEISKAVSDIGRNASYNQGETLHLGDLLPVIDREEIFQRMDAELDEARKADPDKFETSRLKIWQKYSDLIEKEAMKSALAKGNNLAYSVASGARGKPPQLKAMIATPGLYTDYKDNVIPLFVRHSFADGLRPAEYLAGAFGARKSVVSTKSATARGGDWSKQAVQTTANLIVTSKDCRTNRGILLPADDSSMRGRVLATETAGLPAGTMVDKRVLQHFQKKGVKKVVVRSAMTCDQHEGICAKCVGGFYEGGKLPKIGDAVGITGSQSLGEPITQGALNVKHQGGQAKGKREYAGFDVINQIAQSPETFPDRATVSELDGTVQDVQDAPQGGKYIFVDGEKHYVPQGYEIMVRPGDRVEAGDQLSDGIVDPGDIVRLRGLGEGRKFFAERLKKAMDDSGMDSDLRNTEILARSAIDHVVVEDPEGIGDFLPDDVVSYNTLQRKYVPPADTKALKAREAHGKYLQSPVLHYSIGTRITPRIASTLEEAGIRDVRVTDTSPALRPEMSRLRTAAHSNPDWLASMHTSYLKDQLSYAAVRGDTTDVRENTHFAPRLAIGTGFGKNVRETGKF